MTPTPDDDITPADRELIEHFRQAYAPPPLSAAQRNAMRNALQSRLYRRWQPSWPSLAMAACAAAVAMWIVLPGRSSAPPAATGGGDVLAAYAFESDSDGGVDDVLPQDYATIEYIFDL